MTDATTDLDAEQLTQTREFLASVGKDELAERLGEELDDRRDGVERVAEMRVLREQAEKAGLDDDPAVEALAEHADALAEDLGLGPEPHDPERLAGDHGLAEDAVADLSEDTRQELKEHLSAVDTIESSGRVEGAAKYELQRRRDRLERLLDDAGADPARLVADDADSTRKELAAALAPAEETDVDVDSARSPRVRRARLEDRRQDLQEDLAAADSKLLSLTLEQRLETVEERLDDTDAEA